MIKNEIFVKKKLCEKLKLFLSVLRFQSRPRSTKLFLFL